MNKFIDLTGQRFGRLTVIKRIENNKYGSAQWLCLCDCGTKKIILGICLRAASPFGRTTWHKKYNIKTETK